MFGIIALIASLECKELIRARTFLMESSNYPLLFKYVNLL